MYGAMFFRACIVRGTPRETMKPVSERNRKERDYWWRQAGKIKVITFLDAVK